MTEYPRIQLQKDTNLRFHLKSKDTCEKHRRYFDAKIPQLAFFTLSIVGKMILMDGFFNS